MNEEFCKLLANALASKQDIVAGFLSQAEACLDHSHGSKASTPSTPASALGSASCGSRSRQVGGTLAWSHRSTPVLGSLVRLAVNSHAPSQKSSPGTGSLTRQGGGSSAWTRTPSPTTDSLAYQAGGSFAWTRTPS